MTARHLFPLFAFLVSPIFALASPLSAPISEVVVFPDRAMITRSGSASLPAGIDEITIVGLPRDLLPDSLQVAAQAAAPLTILDVRTATRFGVPEGIDRLKPLLAKQKELETEIAQIDLNLAALRKQLGFVEKIEDSVTAPRTEGDVPSPEEWNSLLQFFQTSLADLLPRIHEQETLRTQRAEELKAVTQQIAQTRGAEQTETREVIVRFESDEPTEARFTVSYSMMNAGWTPEYNVRVDSTGKDIRLDYRVAIRQRTGEDWNDVQLTLSTARPSLGGTPPELQPWIVDVRQPPMPVPTLRRAEKAAFSDAGLLAFEPPPPEADFASAEVQSSLTAVQMRPPVPASIPADGEEHRIGIGTYPLTGDFFYTVVPKLSNHAFPQSTVTHPGPAPILPGRANIFLDGNLTGTSFLPRVDPEQAFDLPLGIDEAITVERKLLHRLTEERGLLNKTTRTRFEFLTTLTNRRSTTEKLILKDQIPVSRHQDINVHPIELSGGQPLEDAPGQYEWELILPPGEEAKIPLSFAVEHPKEMPISGL